LNRHALPLRSLAKSPTLSSLKSLSMDSWFSISAGGALVEVNDLGSLAVGQKLRRELDL